MGAGALFPNIGNYLLASPLTLVGSKLRLWRTLALITIDGTPAQHCWHAASRELLVRYHQLDLDTVWR